MTTRLGMLTPSSNTVLEPVCARMAADLKDTSVHFSRFTVTRIALDQTALGQFDTTPMVGASMLLADAKVDVIAWNGTSASWLGLDSDRDLVGMIESRTNIPAATCVLSMMDALRLLNARTYALVTPYTSDVQERIVDNLEGHGLSCVAEVHFGLSDNFSFGTVPPSRVRTALREVCAARPDAVIVLCTNLAGAPVAAEIEAETSVPVLDSVALTMWGALRRIGADTSGLASWGQTLAGLGAREAAQ